jgi:hypothetical protein
VNGLEKSSVDTETLLATTVHIDELSMFLSASEIRDAYSARSSNAQRAIGCSAKIFSAYRLEGLDMFSPNQFYHT